MRYTVVWVPRAAGTLANLWMKAPDRQSVADASNRLDVILADDPELKGKPLGRLWTRYEPPLAVLYEVIPDDRMVRVVSIKRI